ncbi:MAG: YlxR family protein [Anaerolineales bacterium]|nr:YlxR family protein [Anaerolineales bacterium]
MTKKKPRQKHIPQRTCVGCREVLPKRSLIRIVRSQEGVLVDPSGKLAGRGAYLHDKASCWKKALKGSLAQALKTELSASEREQLTAFAASLSPVGDELEEGVPRK